MRNQEREKEKEGKRDKERKRATREVTQGYLTTFTCEAHL